MKTVVIVNGPLHISLNAAHFGAMSAEEGPKRIIQDGFTTDEAWAKEAHALCVKAVMPKGETQKAEALAEAKKASKGKQ